MKLAKLIPAEFIPGLQDFLEVLRLIGGLFIVMLATVLAVVLFLPTLGWSWHFYKKILF